jgi:hypothetical protein
MFIRTDAIALAIALAALALPVKAQQSCAPRDDIARELGGRYAEAQSGAGLQSQDRIVEIWSSDEGSWTLLVTHASGISCVIAAGTHWRAVEPPVELSGIPG